MKSSAQWFANKTQQTVMMRASVLPVMARTGPNTKSGAVAPTKKTGEGVFKVGVSVVGGPDRVRRTK